MGYHQAYILSNDSFLAVLSTTFSEALWIIFKALWTIWIHLIRRLTTRELEN